MSIVTEAQVQQWLESTKLTIDNVDNELEATAKSIVFGQLTSAYDITSWIDDASTPKLVQEVMSLYIAAWIYNRAYSEDSTGTNSYSTWLENKAVTLLGGIANGAIDLPEVSGFESNSTPLFTPNNSTVDEFGWPLGPAFTMGARF